MSFITKLFIGLSVFSSLLFVLLSGVLVAKQRNYEARLGREGLALEEERRTRDELGDRYAALIDEKRARILRERETLLEMRAQHRDAEESSARWREKKAEVTERVQRFQSVTGITGDGQAEEFQAIVAAYEEMLGDLDRRVVELAQRVEEVSSRRSSALTHTAGARAFVGRAREDINQLDYQLYHLNVVNEEKREIIRVYREILGPDIGVRTTPANLFGEVTRVDAHMGSMLTIGIGLNDRVENNIRLAVFRGNRFIAHVIVVRAYESRSVCRVDPQSVNGTVEIGDEVRTPGRYSSTRGD